MLLLITIILSVAVGVALALCHARASIRIAAFIAVFLVSNLLSSWLYFTRDPKTWITTYLSGILLSGAASLFFHVLPAILSYHLTVWIRKETRKE
jgi:hypothetical protein